ncbi:MAG: MBL fold metallo-hydrolase [Gemmatimonadaceae bacterium]|nr:MBL fold metallo-hydrolase [Gemmatimonadaceae bacterium]
MRIVSLASGSSGNAIVIDAGGTRVLVDCGIGPRTLARRLDDARIAPESVSAVVVTHEHVDHCRGLAAALRRWPWLVLASAGTIRGLDASVLPRATAVKGAVDIGGITIRLVAVAHDANEPTAVAVADRHTGMRAGIAHDLGEPSTALVDSFRGVNLLCIEANHDTGMLRGGPYPAHLKARIAGATGHLSNDQAAAFIAAVGTRDLRAVLLLHLSEVNNTPLAACEATRRGVHRRARLASLDAAVRRAPSAPIGAAAAQLALAI